MPEFSAERLVNVPQAIAFKVAADVAHYKEFLPLLTRSTIRGVRQRSGDVETFKAELAVAYDKLGLRESFVSDVQVDHSTQKVTARSVDGPFKSVETSWLVTPSPTGSLVKVSISYQLKSTMLQFAVTALMPMATEKIMSAFEQRALTLHRPS